jgi:hypothetical protein
MGGWDSQGLSFCIGIMGTVFSFVGGDGPIHVRLASLWPAAHC